MRDKKLTDTSGVVCGTCRTPDRCDRFGCAIASSMIATGEPRDTWMEVEPGVLTFIKGLPNTGWEPGGPHGAKCDGGPLHGVTVLVQSSDLDVAQRSPLTVEGHASGHYVWHCTEPYGVLGLRWRPAGE